MTATESFGVILPFFPERLQSLIVDETVSDLMITGGRVFVDRDGRLSEVASLTVEHEALDAAVQNIARLLGGDVGRNKPILDARLPDGSRVAAVYPPNSPDGITLTIRRFNRWFSTGELVEHGVMTPEAVDTVFRALLDKKNVLIAGGTGSGKTTLLNAFLQHVPMHERLIVIEKPAELQIAHRNAVRWEATDETRDHPAVTVGNLLVAALRHRPDRIVIGEVRDHSAYELLQAMNTGHSGTLSTIHADSAIEALYRLSDLALSAHSNLDSKFVRSQTARAIHYVVYVSRNSAGQRAVQEVVRVAGYSAATEEFVAASIHKA